MPPNFDRLALAPIYRLSGFVAQFTPEGEDGAIDLTVKEKSAAIDSSLGSLGLSVQSLEPALLTRRSELVDNGLEADDLVGGTITAKGVTWSVKTVRSVSSPNGTAEGEVEIVLQDPQK